MVRVFQEMLSPSWRNGRRYGLKIRWTVRSVWVRFPLGALNSTPLSIAWDRPALLATQGGADSFSVGRRLSICPAVDLGKMVSW